MMRMLSMKRSITVRLLALAAVCVLCLLGA